MLVAIGGTSVYKIGRDITDLHIQQGQYLHLFLHLQKWDAGKVKRQFHEKVPWM